MKYTEKIKTIEWLAHNVVRIELPKPAGFEFNVGDAVEIKVADNEPGPFTMTNLPDGDTLEFIIRIYTDHHGKTEALSKLKANDELSFTEPFNTYKPAEGAIFLAGGTGITPFIAIMREMYNAGTLKDSILIFSNKSAMDVFLKEELYEMLGNRYKNVITGDNEDPDYYGNIDEKYLKEHITDVSKPILVCGPPPFNEAMEKNLKKIGVEPENIDLGS
ncbi:flavodoxin reductase [Chondrinema litorale]|uniref:flavodoxin reductase n=1 Tax=Chondrinema litorale TaxID=2994555 RepID=UPI002543B0E9|nr:flavodoxin reductase [Chondrinema litorale]UZR97170.1 flavodoxin reductase [Chondrinema litorale]